MTNPDFPHLISTNLCLPCLRKAVFRSRLFSTSLLVFGISFVCSFFDFVLPSTIVYALSENQAISNALLPLDSVPTWLFKSRDAIYTLAWGDVDNDGDLDLAVGGYFGTDKLYLNQNGKLQIPEAWTSVHTDDTSQMVWADVDSDGDLDLTTVGSQLRIYHNDDGTLDPSPSLVFTDTNPVTIAWGDVDSDGDFDLAMANGSVYQPSCNCYVDEKDKVFRNDRGVLDTTIPLWVSTDNDQTSSVAWGDVDNDGDLDLAVGNVSIFQPSCFCYIGGEEKIYLNESGVLRDMPVWISNLSDDTSSIAWGDFNNDGYLDLATGGRDGINLYKNIGEMLETTPGITSTDSYLTSFIAWGDVDNDGDLDLAADYKVYLNQNGILQTTASWSAADTFSYDMSWADVDGDGDLDFMGVGFRGIQLHINEWNVLHSAPSWAVIDGYEAYDFAWGDVTGDGKLELGSGNGDGPSNIYANQNNQLEQLSKWMTEDSDWASSIAWGDVDGDGDLDLALGNNSTRIYLNQDGNLAVTASWVADGFVSSIAWGDVDNDVDLDLVTGGNGQLNLYVNDNGILQPAPTWTSIDTSSVSSVVWGDVDGDGDLDLAVGGEYQPSKLYMNNSGVLQRTAIWLSEDTEPTSSIAWGDVDGDGDLDLAVGGEGEANRLYLNEYGMLHRTPDWYSNDRPSTSKIAWGDIDNDGDLDLGVVGKPTRIYINVGSRLQPNPITIIDEYANTIAWGDVDRDGTFDLAVGSDSQKEIYLNRQPLHPTYVWPNNRPAGISIELTSTPVATFNNRFSTVLAPANHYAVPGIRQSGVIPIYYNLFQPGNEPVRAIRVYYSLDGSFSGDRSQWRVAKPALGTQLTDLSASVYPTKTTTNTHVFTWDVFGSGFMGQSDNVVVRIEALPNLKPIRNGVPSPFQRPYVATQTFPFRVRGNQVRIINATQGNIPASQGVVYRLPAGQTQVAMPLTANSSKLLRTDQQGYLQGRGRLETGDRLFALAPITATDKYTVYHTNGVVTSTGLDGYTVQAGGIQTLTVSAANTLILYNLTVSLEWDARNDPTFMTQLENDLRRTSQILFDLTNGQAALGDVRIYHDKGFWGTADVVITASNNQRPNAILGGSVLTATGDIDIQGNPIVDAYVPGQVRMGATWNRFGNPNGTLGEDWPRTLAHELGHYLFFVPDNYIGVTPDRQFVQIVDCQGSVMTDPYEESYSEFLTADQWQTDACQRSVAAVYLGRPDWATITRFYPMLNGRGGNPGPAQLPLAVTRITTFAPPRSATTLAAPFFPLVNQQGQTISVPDGRGQAYLFKTGNNSDPTDDYVIALGTPIGDLVQARGATPGDRLCVFDFANQPLRLGCLAQVGNAPAPITLAEVADWSPQIQVRGVTTNTVIVTVTNVSADNLAVQLLPAMGVASAEIPMTRQGDAFVQTVTAADGAYFGFVRVWVPGSNPYKEIIVEYSANEAWDGRARAWGTSADAWGGRARAWGGRAYGWGGRARAWGAPVMSSDGQVSIFPLDNPFAGGAHYTLQSVTFPPSLPTWLTPVGQAYRVVSDGTLARSAILFSYLGRDVPDGYEKLLTIYYSSDEGRNWQRLPTDLDVNRNQVSAPVLGEGIYLLVVTVPVTPTLTAGWNTIGYPVQASQPISPALASIAQKYSIVYHYQTTPAPTWQTFAPTVPAPFAAAVNDLTQLEFGRAYWLYATEAVTLYLGVESQLIASSNAAVAANAPAAPAIYYGWVVAAPNFTPVEGMRVRAEIDGVVCGETTVQLFNGQLGYILRVAATDLQTTGTTCGQGGKIVKFVVGDVPMAQSVLWNNQSAWNLSLSTLSGIGGDPLHTTVVYLPLIRK